jgi:hypothetical protein
MRSSVSTLGAEPKGFKRVLRISFMIFFVVTNFDAESASKNSSGDG